MTETEWLAGAELDPILAFLRGKVSDRKLRLFACACCRELWDSLEDERSRRAVDVAERHADDGATYDERRDARHAAQMARSEVNRAVRMYARAAYEVTHPDAWEAARYAYIYCDYLGRSCQRALLHDICGNPFRPVALDSDWLTSDVCALARGIYDEKAFDRMPILADALQDAGCANDDVLTHCRDANQLHARGCWVIDLLLGKG